MGYNNTYEYNSIKTGSTVYIAGIPGNNYSFCNNKFGWVKDVLLTYTNRNVTYVAQIVLIPTNDEVFVNFDYIYNIKNLNKFYTNDLAWEENAMNYYVNKKILREIESFHDEKGQLLAVATDIYKTNHVFFCSGLN